MIYQLMKCTSMSWLISSSTHRDNMDVCKTDMQRIIKYFDDAAKVYDTLPGQRNNCRAWVIRQLNNKLRTKLNNNLKQNLNQNEKK